MANYITHRLARSVITLVVFQTILFFLIHAVPWDAVDLIRVPAGSHQAIRHIFGLDLPLWEQYLIWMKGFFTGDLGRSLQLGGQSVMALFTARIPRTLLLFLPGTMIGFVLGLWLGKHIAWRRGGLLEFGATLSGVILYASFTPWLAFVLITIFAIRLRWMPQENILDTNLWARTGLSSQPVILLILLTMVVYPLLILAIWYATRPLALRRWTRLGASVCFTLISAYVWLSSGFAIFAQDILHHLALPLTTLVLLSFGETMLLMRTTMIDVIKDDHVLLARAKGLDDSQVRDRHVARLALFPVIARFIIQLPLMIIGSFVLERVFFWQGIGELLFRAIDSYDVPVIMGILSLVGVVMLLAHSALDILIAWLDPRIRASQLRTL